MSRSAESAILDAWHANAAAWAAAVRGGAIESRRRGTDRAIVDVVRAHAPRRVLDIGCGEGWLVRALAAAGADGLGVDAVPALVDAARALGGGEFRVLGYADLAAGLHGPRFDVAVANFALLGEGSAEAALRGMATLLAPGGVAIVQTLHPLIACGDAPYADGWREGSWAGCGPGFGAPAPWYFRTLEGWLNLFEVCGLQLRALREPLHPDTRRPVSVIFEAEPRV